MVRLRCIKGVETVGEYGENVDYEFACFCLACFMYAR